MSVLDRNYLINNLNYLDNHGIDVPRLANKLWIEICNQYNISKDSSESLKNEITNYLNKYQSNELSQEDFINSFETLNPTVNINNQPTLNYDNYLDKKNDDTKIEHTIEDTHLVEEENNIDIDSNDNNQLTENVNENFNINNLSISGRDSIISSINGGSIEGNDEGDIVDVDSDVINRAAADLDSIASDISGIEIVIPGAVSQYASGIKSAANNAKSQANSALSELKGAIRGLYDSVENIDGSIPDVDANEVDLNTTSFEELVSQYNKSQNSRAVQATREFFENGGCTIDGDFAILDIDGHECKYNMKTHKFYFNGEKKEAFEAYFYLPSDATDYSKLNTYTFFVENTPKNKSYIENRDTNSVILRITKYGAQNPFTKYDEVALATRFTNKVANTDLSTCQNAIGGDSMYGSKSLQIAAQNGDLYQTVYCVNNAALVPGINSHETEKEHFASIEELRQLDGKNIYFISASGDDNYGTHADMTIERGRGNIPLRANANGVFTYEEYQTSFTYTGIELVSKECPNANVHILYQDVDTEKPCQKTELARALNDLADEYPNCTYESPEVWDSAIRGKYHYHSEGNIAVSDLAEAPFTNANAYNTQ